MIAEESEIYIQTCMRVSNFVHLETGAYPEGTSARREAENCQREETGESHWQHRHY